MAAGYLKTILSALALWLACESAHAAQITTGMFPGLPASSVIRIVVRGSIVPSDITTFKKVLGQIDAATEVQNSPARPRIIVDLAGLGGDFDAAVAIGKTIHARRSETYVEQDAICMSACALIWLSGYPAHLNNRAHIGFHAPYDPTTLQTPPYAEPLVEKYTSALGLSDQVSDYVVSKSLGLGLAWITPQIAAALGIPTITDPTIDEQYTTTSTQMIDAIDRAKSILKSSGSVATFSDLSSCYAQLEKDRTIDTAYLCFAAEMGTREAILSAAAAPESAAAIDAVSLNFVSQDKIKARTLSVLQSIGYDQAQAIEILNGWISLNNNTMKISPDGAIP